ncbi:MAG: SAM-dependent methyltransferase, partial [Actinomycetota bacterium]
LSDEYHAPFVAGGHVRIYRGGELRRKISRVGLEVGSTHKAHGLHSPYWWLRCAVGPQREDNKAVAIYKKFLEWDIISAPTITRAIDKALSPMIGKSYVVYATKPTGRLVGAKK